MTKNGTQSDLKESQEHNDASYKQGLTYKSMGHFEEAAKCFFAVTEKNPNAAQAFNQLGVVYMMQKQYDKAINAFQKGLSVTPDNLCLLLNLARVRKMKGEFIAAKKIIQGALELDNNNAAAHFLLGTCFMDMDDFEEAYSEFKKAISINPEDTEISLAFARSSEKLQLSRAASIKLNAPLSKTALDDACNYLSCGKVDLAHEIIHKILIYNPESLPALNLLAQYYICAGNNLNARQTFTRIKSLDPGYVQHYYDAALRLRQLGKESEAVLCARAFIEKKPDSVEGMKLLEDMQEEQKLQNDKCSSCGQSKKLLALFATLKSLMEFLPDSQKESFMTSKNRIQIEYIIASLQGKQGLLAASSSLPESNNNQNVSDLSGSKLIQEGLKVIQDLASGLKDERLKRAVTSLIESKQAAAISCAKL